MNNFDPIKSVDSSHTRTLMNANHLKRKNSTFFEIFQGLFFINYMYELNIVNKKRKMGLPQGMEQKTFLGEVKALTCKCYQNKLSKIFQISF